MLGSARAWDVEFGSRFFATTNAKLSAGRRCCSLRKKKRSNLSRRPVPLQAFPSCSVAPMMLLCSASSGGPSRMALAFRWTGQNGGSLCCCLPVGSPCNGTRLAMAVVLGLSFSTFGFGTSGRPPLRTTEYDVRVIPPAFPSTNLGLRLSVFSVFLFSQVSHSDQCRSSADCAARKRTRGEMADQKALWCTCSRVQKGRSPLVCVEISRHCLVQPGIRRIIS